MNTSIAEVAVFAIVKFTKALATADLSKRYDCNNWFRHALFKHFKISNLTKIIPHWYKRSMLLFHSYILVDVISLLLFHLFVFHQNSKRLRLRYRNILHVIHNQNSIDWFQSRSCIYNSEKFQPPTQCFSPKNHYACLNLIWINKRTTKKIQIPRRERKRK